MTVFLASNRHRAIDAQRPRLTITRAAVCSVAIFVTWLSACSSDHRVAAASNSRTHDETAHNDPHGPGSMIASLDRGSNREAARTARTAAARTAKFKRDVER